MPRTIPLLRVSRVLHVAINITTNAPYYATTTREPCSSSALSVLTTTMTNVLPADDHTAEGTHDYDTTCSDVLTKAAAANVLMSDVTLHIAANPDVMMCTVSSCNMTTNDAANIMKAVANTCDNDDSVADADNNAMLTDTRDMVDPAYSNDIPDEHGNLDLEEAYWYCSLEEAYWYCSIGDNDDADHDADAASIIKFNDDTNDDVDDEHADDDNPMMHDDDDQANDDDDDHVQEDDDNDDIMTMAAIRDTMTATTTTDAKIVKMDTKNSAATTATLRPPPKPPHSTNVNDDDHNDDKAGTKDQAADCLILCTCLVE